MASLDYNKRAGRETENLVAEYLSKALDLSVERRRQKGARDEGDLSGVPGWVIEVKKSLARPAELLDQIDAEVENAGADYGAGIVRRRGDRDPANWYALMSVSQLADIICDLDARWSR